MPRLANFTLPVGDSLPSNFHNCQQAAEIDRLRAENDQREGITKGLKQQIVHLQTQYNQLNQRFQAGRSVRQRYLGC